jgi:hypothetical protein
MMGYLGLFQLLIVTCLRLGVNTDGSGNKTAFSTEIVGRALNLSEQRPTELTVRYLPNEFVP